MRRVGRAVLALSLAVTPLATGHAMAKGDTHLSSLATYHGRTIDLSVSWEGAQACSISASGNSCFDSDAEMTTALAAATSASHDAGILSTCASSLHLYGATGFGLPHLALNGPEGTFISLSGYGFSGVTSSYSVGSCSSAFRDGSNITYPGSTSAGASASSMVSGWDNRITKVYIS